MENKCRETAVEILEEYTNCYSEADEDCLVKMLEKLATDLAEEIFAEIEEYMITDAIDERFPMKCINPDKLAELKKKYTVTDTNVGCKESENDNGKM